MVENIKKFINDINHPQTKTIYFFLPLLTLSKMHGKEKVNNKGYQQQP